MRDSVPSARYSSVCNVLRQWRILLIPTYRVYRLYDNAMGWRMAQEYNIIRPWKPVTVLPRVLHCKLYSIYTMHICGSSLHNCENEWAWVLSHDCTGFVMTAEAIELAS